jgi:hypothetical protein
MTTLTHIGPDIRTAYATLNAAAWPITLTWNDLSQYLTVGWFEPANLLNLTAPQQASIQAAALFAYQNSRQFPNRGAALAAVQPFITLW